MSNPNEMRLDAAESVFFQRQLESIDGVAYQHKYPKYKARGFIPTQGGVNPSARVYTYRMFDQQGSAVPIANAADDLPMANASGGETSQRIQNLGCAYGFDIFEIKEAAMTGTPLDSMRAIGARRAMEEKIDKILALGDTSLGLSGILKLSGTTTATSSGFWGTLATADPDKVAGDLLRVLNAGVEATDEAFNRFQVVLPLAMYNIAATLKMSSQSNVTVLEYVRTVSPYLDSIDPWYRCEAATGGAIDSTHDLIAAFPRDPECVAALVPRELEFMTPEQRNLSYVINGHAACGGVVVRYPKAITYMSVATS